MNIFQHGRTGAQYICAGTLCVNLHSRLIPCVLYRDLFSTRTWLRDYQSFMAPGRFFGIGYIGMAVEARRCEWAGDDRLFDDFTEFKIETCTPYLIHELNIEKERISLTYNLEVTAKIAVESVNE